MIYPCLKIIPGNVKIDWYILDKLNDCLTTLAAGRLCQTNDQPAARVARPGCLGCSHHSKNKKEKWRAKNGGRVSALQTI
jgi:hypothetical protein